VAHRDFFRFIFTGYKYANLTYLQFVLLCDHE